MTLQEVFKGVTQERWEKTQRLIRCIGKALGLRDQYTNGEEIGELMAKMVRTTDMPHNEMIVGSFTSRPGIGDGGFDLRGNDSHEYEAVSERDLSHFQLLETQP